MCVLVDNNRHGLRCRVLILGRWQIGSVVPFVVFIALMNCTHTHSHNTRRYNNSLVRWVCVCVFNNNTAFIPFSFSGDQELFSKVYLSNPIKTVYFPEQNEWSFALKMQIISSRFTIDGKSCHRKDYLNKGQRKVKSPSFNQYTHNRGAKTLFVHMRLVANAYNFVAGCENLSVCCLNKNDCILQVKHWESIIFYE